MTISVIYRKTERDNENELLSKRFFYCSSPMDREPYGYSRQRVQGDDRGDA